MAIVESNVHWGRPEVGRIGTGALVLAGSSGRIDTGRVDMLAARGVTAMGLRWFGGDGLPAVPVEVPLEYFTEAIDLIASECDRLVLMGLSYGAEAALLTATIDQRLAGVVAIQPTDVAWEGQARNDDDPHLSKWTLQGRPVPFVPMDRTWQLPPTGKPAFVDFYERSREVAGPDIVAAAEIPVTQIPGQVLLVAGGDDKVWASLPQAKRIAARREDAGLPTTIVCDERAGHPVVLPGEALPDLDRPYQVGGDDGAPQRLGGAAWPHIAHLLDIAA
ncbi:alpha/beta fold hydrolase [Intrasporangium calvum]|uniref:Alpha/beta fold hydrolase n=1 Tax=Intrasporangium calvum TaxID=53358 RepID=A0ABT5GGN2_9MICO|nr:alpha/beta fold hydrolase [Intrasporangium calvum]MDC5697277.1 alpha/beta fold hydrolase [Intrasporangium calvum]